MTLDPKPEGFHTVTPYLLVEGAEALLEFAAKAFDAVEGTRHSLPDGKIMYADIKIGDSIVMISDAREEFGASPAMLYVYVDDVDATYQRALEAGGVSIREPTDEFYGDRAGGVRDPCGNQWWIATRKEDVSPEEMERRAAQAARERSDG